ncbi:hypothetical protein AB0E27_11415 [Streptomyces sparsogenes]|uniref:hypothetical protein n=1 Tax=Streptomyces sparsogenes TaxID=67365 RepID=UPI0033FA3BF1
MTACRHGKLTAHVRAAGLGTIADLGFVGPDDSDPDADPVLITGYKDAPEAALDLWPEAVQQGPRRGPGSGRARLPPT